MGQVKLGPLAHLLPYHHPATLAIQTAWMSQGLQGRLSDAGLAGNSRVSHCAPGTERSSLLNVSMIKVRIRPVHGVVVALMSRRIV